MDTAACYKKYDEAPDEKRNDAETCASGLVSGDFQMLCRGVYNALGAPAAKLNGDVQTALDELAKFSPAAYAVTGSGSAAFALFESEELCRWAKKEYRGKFRARVAHTVTPRAKRTPQNPFSLSEEEKKLLE